MLSRILVSVLPTSLYIFFTCVDDIPASTTCSSMPFFTEFLVSLSLRPLGALSPLFLLPLFIGAALSYSNVTSFLFSDPLATCPVFSLGFAPLSCVFIPFSLRLICCQWRFAISLLHAHTFSLRSLVCIVVPSLCLVPSAAQLYHSNECPSVDSCWFPHQS